MTVIFFFSSLSLFFFIIIIIIVLEDEEEEEEALNILFHPYGHLCIYHGPSLGLGEERKEKRRFLPSLKKKSGPCYFPSSLSRVCVPPIFEYIF